MRTITAVTAILMTSATAYAADAIIYQAPAPMIVADTFSWTGGYIGVNAGYGFGSIKFKDTVENDTNAYEPRGFIGGVQAGYNWQFDQFVAGIEADFQGSSMKQSYSITETFGNEYDYGTEESRIKWFGTVRGRLGGVVSDRTLLYGTAGLAYGKVDAKVTMTYGIANTIIDHLERNLSTTRTGWTAGAGAEHAFTDNVTFKVEYLYTDLGKASMPGFSSTVYEFFPQRVSTNFQTVRVGLNYKF